MSIKVARNVDGTLTISCGSETIIMPAAALIATGQSSSTSFFFPITPPGSGVTAGLRFPSVNSTYLGEIILGSVEEVSSSFLSLFFTTGLKIAERKPVYFKLTWTADTPLDLAELAKTLGSVNSSPLTCEVNLTGTVYRDNQISVLRGGFALEPG